MRWICQERSEAGSIHEPLLLLLPGEQAEFYRFDSRPGAVGDFKPGVETLEVALDGGEAHVQLIGDLTVGLVGAKGAQHLELASSERLGEGLLTLPGGRLVEWFFLRLVFFLQLPEQPALQRGTRPLPDGDVVVGEGIRYGGVSGSTSGVRSLGGR
jgi:hypothetical protein